jgi:hypothetical protein
MFVAHRKCEEKQGGYKAHSGNLVGGVSQRLLSKYIFKAAEKEEVQPELFDKIFEHELELINKNEPKMQRMSSAE